MKSLPILGQPTLPPPVGQALFRLAFRPFYLLAALGIAALVPVWLAVFAGRLQIRSGLAPTLWHGHEMIFGVVSAVIVGFLLTAGKTWTGVQTPRGAHLVFLAGLWLTARVAGVFGSPELFAWLDIAFLPLCTVSFLDVLIKAQNRRNYIVAVVLGVISMANAGFHLANWGLIPVSASQALKAGVGGMLLMETLIAGRVVPFFTRSVNPGLENTVPAWREKALAVATVSSLALWMRDGSGPVFSAVLLATAALHAWRLLTWSPRATLRRPILWALFLAYAWIPVGFLLLAIAAATGGTESGATHAFTVGATGGLLIAMMTRTARGHTGRPLQVGRLEVAAYVLVAVAGALRAGAAYLSGTGYWHAVLTSGAAFVAAFAIYFVVYLPWLGSTRLDGKDG